MAAQAAATGSTGKSRTLLAVGNRSRNRSGGWKAQAQLAEQGIGARVVSLPSTTDDRQDGFTAPAVRVAVLRGPGRHRKPVCRTSGAICGP